MKLFRKLLFIISALFCSICCIISCKTIESIKEVDKTQYEASKSEIKTHSIDSIFVHFIDTVKIVQKGDTIYYEIVKWRTKNVYKYLTDSVQVTDTIIIIQNNTLTTQVEKKTPVKTFFDKVATGVIFSCMIGILIFICYIIVKRK